MSRRQPLWIPLFGVYAAAMFLLLALLTLVLLLVLPAASLRSRLAHHSARWLLRLTALSVTLEQRGNMPNSACIVVANHASYLDGLLLKAVLPGHFRFVIKKEMSRVPLVGLFLRRIGSYFVDRANRHSGAMDTRRILRAASHGDSLGFFPEGTFKPEPGLGRFHTGAFVIAVHAGLPVVPVCIKGSRQALPPTSPWLRPARLTVTILQPIPQPLPGSAAASRQATAVALRDLTRARMLAHLAEPDLTQPDSTPLPCPAPDL